MMWFISDISNSNHADNWSVKVTDAKILATLGKPEYTLSNLMMRVII